MVRMALMVGIMGIYACTGDETVAAYGGGDQVWALAELDGAPFTQRATLTFPDPGRIAGFGPCNSYSGVMDAPYPWFEAQKVVVTRRACPDLAAETVFFTALAEVSQSEVAGRTLILRNDAGREMVFKASE